MVLLMISILQLPGILSNNFEESNLHGKNFQFSKNRNNTGFHFYANFVLAYSNFFLANLSFFFRITELISTKLGIKHS